MDEIVSKSTDIGGGTMLYDVVDFHLPSLGAIAIGFSRLPAIRGFLKKFRRAAVLTGKAWLKMGGEFEGMLYPGVQIRAFTREQRPEAEAWLSAE